MRVENAEDFSSPKNDSAFLFLKNFSKKHGVFIHGGSICEKSDEKYYNTTVVFNPQGELIARYRKIHLFCANMVGKICYQESDFFTGGSDIVAYSAENFNIGCTICYDLRFSELYEALRKRKVDIIMAPSAFFACTGCDHWKLLCQTRAIETQSYVIAPNQSGTYQVNGKDRVMWGHSMIVDPWGRVLAEMEDEEGFITVEIDRTVLQKVRSELPVVHSHQIRKIIF